MKKYLTTSLLFALSFLSSIFSKDSLMIECVSSPIVENASMLEEYLAESQKVSEEFTPLYNHLQKEAFIDVDNHRIVDCERWDREYYFPLFERSKQAMQKITGCEDYLSMWEKGAAQTIITAMSNQRLSDQNNGLDNKINLPYAGASEGRPLGLSLLFLYTFAVIMDQRCEIVKETTYDDSAIETNVNESEYSDLLSSCLQTAITESEMEMIRRTLRLERKVQEYGFPPRALGKTRVDPSWFVMAIYSFKNERSENILYDLALNADAQPQHADVAIYWLALSPDSSRFLPDIKDKLSLNINSFQDAYPQLSKILLTSDGSSLNSSSNEYLRTVYDLAHSENKIAYVKFENARRLLSLKRALEFNEKIPENEREHFDIIRRELIVSWILTPKDTRMRPRSRIQLKKGEEQFELYLLEYPTPNFEVYWEDDFLYQNQEDLAKVRRDFYARELAKPRSFYTQDQLTYLRERLNIKR